jgi:pyrimidine deaminase RibD-like protein/GNAT superfamily N-acetyltransferase
MQTYNEQISRQLTTASSQLGTQSKAYRALRAISHVLESQKLFENDPQLGNNSIWLYTEGCQSALHILLDNKTAKITWLGSLNGTGRQLLEQGLAQSQKQGALLAVVKPIWNSHKFYEKMGFQDQGTGYWNLPLEESANQLDRADLEDLLGAITYEQEEINDASYDAAGPKYEKLDKDFKALEAVAYVVKNNLRALDNPNLGKNSIFLYNYTPDLGVFSVTAIHVVIENQVAHVKWLGSYDNKPGAGKALMLQALTIAKNKGATKSVVEAKWESEGFYHKLGYDVENRGSNNPFTGTSLVQMGKKLEEAWTDEDQRMVHKNPTIQDLKRLARNNKYHSARFVIYKDGSVVAADSEHYTHHSAAPAMGAWALRGYVQYLGGNDYAYRSMEVYSPKSVDHPLFRKWESSGIENGNPSVVEEKWTKKYKKSINCSNPQGFSQRAHCAARRKRQKGGKTTSKPLNENNNVEIHNYKKLDRILVALCNLVDTRRKKNPDKYGWVAAGLLDPRNRLVIGFSTFANDKWYHAERLAMRAYRKKYGSIPDGCIIVTTCSPCSEQMPRYGESCTDLINKSPVKKVYCGYSDTTQSQSQRTFNIMVTADTNIRERCQKFAENFMDWEAQYLDESLRDWFKQKWVRFGTDGKIRGDCARGSEGEGKPKCLPQRKAWALGKKKRATAARRKRREDPNPEREGKARNVATKESVGSTKLGDLCTIKTNFPDADFWLVRRSDRTNVGTPAKEFSPYHIGIKVTATEQLMPEYLYYMMMHLHNQGYWNSRSMGMSNLVHIRTEDVKNIQLALTEHELKENSSCPHCGGQMVNYSMLSEKQDACYYKVKSRYKVWPSAYASGALVQCRKKGAKNWGKSKTNESISIDQQEEHGGLEAYITDTSTPQLVNYLASENAPADLAEKLQRRYKTIAVFKNIWVEEDHQGSGVGSWILEAGIGDAIDNQAHAVILTAVSDDPKRQSQLEKWYKSYDFKEIARSSTGYPVMLLDLNKDQVSEAAPWLGQGDEPLPTKLYHVTRTRNRLSIRQRGLVPKTKEHDHILRQPGVFLFETFEQAEDWAYYWSQDEGESMDIWEIKVQDPNDLTPDPALDIQHDYDAWVIYKPIPAANVRLKFTQRWPEPWGKPTTTVKKIRNLEEDPNETE